MSPIPVLIASSVLAASLFVVIPIALTLLAEDTHHDH